MVVSSETKKVAMLATQNIGQCGRVAGGVGITAGAVSELEALLRAEGSEDFIFI